MAERTTITQTTQIGVESSAGTPVAANKLLQSISIEPGIKADIKSFKPRGRKFVTMAALGKEWTEASISGAATYTELVYLLSACLSYAAPTQITPPDGLAYKWTFEPDLTDEDTIKTLTVECGSAVRAGRFAYGIVPELGLTFTRDGIDVSGRMLGHRYEDAHTMTATPTAIDLVPMLGDQVNVYLDNESDDLGTTKLTRVIKATWNIADRFGPFWGLNRSEDSWATHIETDPKPTLKLLLEADAVGMGLLTAMRAGTKKFIRVEAEGAKIETGNNYGFTLDHCGVVTEVSEFSDEDGVYAIEWTFTAAEDADWGKAFTVEMINELSAL